MRTESWTNFMTAGMALLIVGGIAQAQMTTADIAGSVHDAQGLAVTAAHVEAVNQRTGQKFAAEANSLGEYLPRLPATRSGSKCVV